MRLITYAKEDFHQTNNRWGNIILSISDRGCNNGESSQLWFCFHDCNLFCGRLLYLPVFFESKEKETLIF